MGCVIQRKVSLSLPGTGSRQVAALSRFHMSHGADGLSELLRRGYRLVWTVLVFVCVLKQTLKNEL